MAVSDILTRLLLDTTNFDKKIGQSRKQAKQFEKDLNTLGKELGKSFTKMAGTIGVAVTAGEAFNKFISSSDALSDKFQGTMKGLNIYINEFFHTISTGDFTSFVQGMGKIISKAQDAVAAMKDLQNAGMAFSFITSEDDARLQEIMTEFKTGKGNEALKAEGQGILDSRGQATQRMGELAATNLATQIAASSVLSADQISPELIRKVYEDYLGGQELQQAAKTYQETALALKNKYTTTATVQSSAGAYTVTNFNKEGYEAEMKGVIAKNVEAIIYDTLFEKTDNSEGISTASSQYSQAMAGIRSQAALVKTFDKAVKGGATSGGGSAVSYAAGSIGALQQQLKAQQDALLRATDPEQRVEIQRTIDSIKATIEEINLNTAGALSRADNPLPSLTALSTSSLGGASTTVGTTLDIKPQEQAMVSYRDTVGETTEALGYMSNVLGNLSGMVSDGAQEWLAYGANVLQAIGQAIPAIATLTAAKNAEATANTASAASGAASSVASIPYVGAIMAVAAITSVIAAMASLPKFATGGVVGGSSYYGDKILARVNSGEVILNKGQQQTLIGQLDRKNDVHITGELVASGRNLKMTLDNYSNYSIQ